jgi:hypothetical protein
VGHQGTAQGIGFGPRGRWTIKNGMTIEPPHKIRRRRQSKEG